MFRKYSRLLTILILLFAGLLVANPAEASSVVKGTFVNVTYEDVYIDKDVTEKRLKSITIKNDQGQTVTLNIDKFATLSVDTISTTINAFKFGMRVEADVNLRQVKALRGNTGTAPGKIEHGDKVVMGTISFIDNKRTSLSVRLDNGQVNTYRVNIKTNFFKGTTLVDSSTLYEGDRVKLTFSEYNTKFISSLEMITEGVKIENLYKGSLQQIDSARNQLLLTSEKVYRSGHWQTTSNNRNIAYTYSTDTSIYVGNELIKRDELRYYRNHDVYFVTVSQFGQEVIKKIIIKKGDEVSFTEPIQKTNKDLNQLMLKTAGTLLYHPGTIFIRNGRLVDSASLRLGDTAFVEAERTNSNRSVNVVYLSNDGFLSSSLTDHTIYYGQIDGTNGYQLSLKNAKQLSQHTWNNAIVPTLTFTNNTIVTEDSGSTKTTLNAKDNLKNKVGRYGYFYVSNNTIIGVHLVASSTTPAPLVSIGQFESRHSTDSIAIRDVQHWRQGAFNPISSTLYLNSNQATIIRNGKVISIGELKRGDLLYMLYESNAKGRVIFVN